MLAEEINARLTQVGPGTPMGALLRRYWQPVAASPELDAKLVLPIRLMGEDLILYRTRAGATGLIHQRCPHRSASLALGIPEQDGIRCCYHGWKFDLTGQCVEQPAEPAGSTFYQRVQVPAYPVQELGGLVFAYLGPQPAPLLPRYDLFVRDDVERNIGVTRLPCNWLQIMENSLDPVHFEWLHGVYGNYVLEQQGQPPGMKPRHHEEIAFDLFEYGIIKRRRVEGEPESDDWRVGHPVLFPNILAVGPSTAPGFQIRVPIDDANTLIFWYNANPVPAGQTPSPTIRVWDNPHARPDGSLIVDNVNAQDMAAWVTQGTITDRSIERLGESDKGIILYRRLLLEQLELVERGADPMALVRDPARNEMIVIPRERAAMESYNIRRLDLIPGKTLVGVQP